MDKKENTRVLVFVYGGYIMRYLYLLVVIPFYGRVLGVTEYGRVLAAMSLMNVIWMLVSYGFTFVGMRDVSKVHEKREFNDIFSLHLSARLMMGTIGAIVGLTATFCSPVLSQRPLIGLLAMVLGIINGWNLSWLFQGRHQFRTPIMLEVVGFALSLVLVLSIVRGPSDSTWVLASLLIAGLCSTGIAYWLTVKDIGLPRVNFHRVPGLMRDSTMLFLDSTGSVVLTSSSTYLLTLLSTPTQVGYYGAAERFATIGLSLMGPAAQVFIPTISRQMAQNDHQGARSTTRRGAALLLGYGFLALGGALVLSPYVLPLILGHAFCAERRGAAAFRMDVPVLGVQSIRRFLRLSAAQERSLDGGCRADVGGSELGLGAIARPAVRRHGDGDGSRDRRGDAFRHAAPVCLAHGTAQSDFRPHRAWR